MEDITDKEYPFSPKPNLDIILISLVLIIPFHHLITALIFWPKDLPINPIVLTVPVALVGMFTIYTAAHYAEESNDYDKKEIQALEYAYNACIAFIFAPVVYMIISVIPLQIYNIII